MSITPDTKDWTWVLERPCPDCGFDAGAVIREETGPLLREIIDRFRTVVERADVRQRPSPDTWSPLEYACHVRDVFCRFEQRLTLMLTADEPLFDNWDQDATAIEDAYAEQVPSVVYDELAAAGVTLAAHFDKVSGDQWERRGRRSDGAQFTVESLARYLLHDPIHHLHDVGAD